MKPTRILVLTFFCGGLAFSQQPPAPPAPPLPPIPPKVWTRQSLSTDEELKLAALGGLMRNDPKRGLPILEKLLQSSASSALKMRALSTLRQTDAPEAQQTLARIARNSGNPELQTIAIRLLGSDRDNIKVLSEIYASATDAGVKRQVLRSWMAAGAREELLKVARQDASPELRREAIHLLGASGGSESTGELVAIYNSTQDREVRTAVIRALAAGGNSKALIDIARKETNPELKKAAVQHMAHLRDADVATFLMEVIEK